MIGETVEKGRITSNALFDRNLKITAKMRLGEGKVGFYLESGKLIWVTSKHLKRDEWHQIRIERRDYAYLIYSNDRLLHITLEYLPTCGGRLSVLFQGEEAVVENLSISIRGSSFSRTRFS